ncbi:MAG: VOC family protein [Myxococcales bacterium]|nr:VOC family protein [Myxococcales bacterium]
MHSIDHLGINVRDIARSKAFYTQALAPLGIGLVMEFGSAAGFGRNGKPDFWIGQGRMEFQRDEQLVEITPVHVCFTATNREEVDRFYDAAIDAGATDNGGPGLRTQYHPNYYGAFVIDPDGHNVEAVFHGH